jgi:hypothetical protein
MVYIIVRFLLNPARTLDIIFSITLNLHFNPSDPVKEESKKRQQTPPEE